MRTDVSPTNGLMKLSSPRMAEPTVRAKYEKAALKAGKRPFDLAVSDYFKGKDLLAPKSK